LAQILPDNLKYIISEAKMQIISTTYINPTKEAYKTGNSLPENKTQSATVTQEVSSIHELAQYIDPSNMSRNEAAILSGVLFPDEPSATFGAQALILVNDNGTQRNATKSDAIMNERFDMFESIKGQMKFNQQRGISNDNLELAQDYLHKLQIAKTSPSVNIYT
jgi:hypothetical protein